MSILRWVAVVVFLSGCLKGTDPLVGKWRYVYDNPEFVSATCEFFEDGTWTQISADGINLSGTWSRLPDGRMKKDGSLLGMQVSAAATVKFDGDRATLQYEHDEEPVVMERM